MQAIRVHEFGPPNVLQPETMPDPSPGPGEVLIRVRVSGVHLIESRIRAGFAGGPPPPALPYVPGREVGGEVTAVGPGVPDRWLGRCVVANTAGGGGYAELAIVPATLLHDVPTGLELGGAVALMGTGRTALAILDRAALTAGDVVLVEASAGGIGSLLIQAARRAGVARVVGLAHGESKLALTLALGADDAIDYGIPGWTAAVLDATGDRGPTVVFDGVGGEVARATYDLLAPGGRMVSYGIAGGAPLQVDEARQHADGKTVLPLIGSGAPSSTPEEQFDLQRRALASGAAGEWAPVVGQRFALADAAAAHAAIDARATVGKTVLVSG